MTSIEGPSERILKDSFAKGRVPDLDPSAYLPPKVAPPGDQKGDFGMTCVGGR